MAAILFALPLLCMCSDDEVGISASDTSSDNGLFISFSAEDPTTNYYTRSYSSISTSAWDDDPWLESDIYQLDLFVFSQDGDDYTLKKHFTNGAISNTTTLSSPWLLVDDDGNAISYDYVDETDSLYLIGNYDFTDITISSPEDIQSLTTTYASTETPHGPRSRFVFGARQSGASAISAGESTTDAYGNLVKRTLADFALQRTTAKACIYIYYKALDEDSYSLLSDFSDKDITLQVMNYATEGGIIDNGVYPLTETLTITTQDTITTYTYSYKRNVELDSEDSAPTSETYYTDSSNDVCAVIYLYPNDWLDMNKVPNVRYEQPILYEDIDGDGTEEATNTYVQMNVAFTHNGHAKYYEYQIPLNYLLPSDNDDGKYLSPETLDEDDLNTLKAYYSVRRNYVYNVSVFIAEQDTGLVVSVATNSSGSVVDVDDLDDGDTVTITIESDILVETDSDVVGDLDEDEEVIYTVPTSDTAVTE